MSTTLISLIVGNIFAFGLALFTYFTTRKKVSAETDNAIVSGQVNAGKFGLEYAQQARQDMEDLRKEMKELRAEFIAMKTEYEKTKEEKIALAIINGEQVKRIATLETKVSELEIELKRFHDIEQNLKDVDVHAKVDSMVAEIKSEIIK